MLRDILLIELRILGSVRLKSSDGRDVEVLARHAKRTALFAYLAAARPRGPHRRDTLLALFWPESDAARARAALNQALYVVRASLGDDAIVSRGDGDVSLDEKVVWCDAAAFDAALDAGRPGDALALYHGDLLEGFFVSGAPEFERWLERERARLRERASQGAWLLAEASAASGEALEATRWARRAAELLPADEAVARRLIRFLAGLGDRPAAVRAYEEFTSRLAREYELEPSAETRALAAAIREIDVARPFEHTAQPTSSGPARPVRRNRRGSRRRAVVLALLAGSLLVGGWFVRRNTDEPPKRLAVLPFTNLGRADDEYFADGITEEIAAQLGTIDRLRVIGRTTAARYKGSQKTIPEIGRELGVAYVLEGSVRWETPQRGPARVRVTPRLVNTADGTDVWAEVYDEPLDQIFRVQSDIAQRVVRALDIRLLDRLRSSVVVPTRNLEAYDYYLRGNVYMSRGLDERYAHAAVRMYERAVQLDPAFALAYARLARVNSRIYWYYYDRSSDRLARAKAAVDKAFELQPELPQVHLALGVYYWHVHLDYDRALHEFAIAEAGLPNESDLLATRAVLRQRQGEFGKGFEDYVKARQLDPGSALIAHNYAAASGFVGEFARAESLFDRAIQLSPDWYSPYFGKAGTYLRWKGGVKEARAVLEQARAGGVHDPLLLLEWVLVDLFDRKYDDAASRLTSGFPEAISWQFQFIPRAQLLAETFVLMERRELARAYYDSARIVVSHELRSWPDDPRLHGALGIAYAGLGRKEEAIAEGKKGVDLLPVSQEAQRGHYREWDLARIYTMVGEHDAAVDLLERLLSIPGHLTTAWLRIDPTWDPLRTHPGFRRLIAREQSAMAR